VNLRRGFFRMWLGASALWLVGVGVVALYQFNSSLIPPQIFIMPDATSGFFKLDNISDPINATFTNEHWCVDFPNNVQLCAVNGIAKSVVQGQAESFFQMYSEPRAAELRSARLSLAGTMLVTALAPPLALLALGALGSWIIGGFRSSEAGP
jgi:hypothetical protein